MHAPWGHALAWLSSRAHVVGGPSEPGGVSTRLTSHCEPVGLSQSTLCCSGLGPPRAHEPLTGLSLGDTGWGTPFHFGRPRFGITAPAASGKRHSSLIWTCPHTCRPALALVSIPNPPLVATQGCVRPDYVFGGLLLGIMATGCVRHSPLGRQRAVSPPVADQC